MRESIETRFTRDYGVRHPIALAPMAFVGTAPDLAIAVCKAGGLGSLAVGPLPPMAVRRLVQAVRATTSWQERFRPSRPWTRGVRERRGLIDQDWLVETEMDAVSPEPE